MAHFRNDLLHPCYRGAERAQYHPLVNCENKTLFWLHGETPWGGGGWVFWGVATILWDWLSALGCRARQKVRGGGSGLGGGGGGVRSRTFALKCRWRRGHSAVTALFRERNSGWDTSKPKRNTPRAPTASASFSRRASRKPRLTNKIYRNVRRWRKARRRIWLSSFSFTPPSPPPPPTPVCCQL